jgi:2-C-methyl-D-erythritol 4-phosphate cytidylyltransferase
MDSSSASNGAAPEGPVWAVVVAAGLGRRFGAEKQFLSLLGRPVHLWAVEASRSVADGVVLVVPLGRENDPDLIAAADRVVAGGETRSQSVRAGLRAVPENAGIIVVHDGVRPMASEVLFRAVVTAVAAGADGAIPGLEVADTVKRVEGGVVRATIDRSNLVRVQTPQAFRASTLRAAHATEAEVTDDSAVLEAIGATVVVVPGEEDNLKITSPADLALLEWRLASTTAGQVAP